MKGKIYINGVIGLVGEEQGIELLDVILQVKEQPKATSFDVYINSPGGVVQVGFDIYHYLKKLGKPIRTIGSGLVASIATVIFMAGDERVLKPNTDFLIHLPMGGVSGNADEISEYEKLLRKTEKQVIDFYVSNTNLSKEEVLPLLQYETTLKVEEAYKLGFTTEKPREREIVAYINPNSKNKMSKKKNLLTRMMRFFEITNKVVLDANSNEIVFVDLDENATPKVGDKAEVGGEPAKGEYIIPDENDADKSKVYVFEDGILTEIREEEEEVSEEEFLDLLENMTTKMETLEAENKALKEKNSEYEKTIQAIKKAEGKPPADHKKSKPNFQKETGFSRAIKNIKNKKDAVQS